MFPNVRNPMISIFFAFILLFILLSCCCYYPDKYHNPTDQLPEQIYKKPRVNRYFGIRVGILDFKSPSYAKGSGELAAELLSKELKKRNIYSKVKYYNNMLFSPRKTLRNFVKSEKLDLVITGELVYYLEGGNYQSSRICVEIKCLEPLGKNLDTVWHALCCQKGKFSMPRYYIFFSTNGQPSVSGPEILQKIALKFTNMLSSIPPIQD